MTDKSEIKISVDEKGDKIVIIPQVIFKGKRSINWNEIEKYLQQYVGALVSVTETKDVIYIGKDFPAEYKGSNYSKNIRGAILKAKANAVQGIAELINIATEKTWVENKKEKHKKIAKNGWYYFKTRFALPVYEGEIKTNYYNIYSARLVVHASSKRLYLYDMVDIKKETSTPL